MHFKDVPPDHTHANDIEWLAEQGITKGANPPANDLFKPDDAVTRGQMASFLRRLHGTVVEAIPDPEPEPERTVLWSTSFEDGFGDYTRSYPCSDSGNASSAVTSAPDRPGNAVAMSIVNSSAGTGTRLRQDGGSTPLDDLPDAVFTSAWFYIPDHIRVGNGDGGSSSDAWNIYQFKQTHPNNSGGYTRRMIASVALRDMGSDYAFTVSSRAHDDGTWGDPKDQFFIGEDARVRAGEWFHLETFRRFSSDPAVGQFIVVVNGVEIFNRKMLTEIDGWKFNKWKRQWTINNYNVGSHTPNTHTLYGANLSISV